MTPRTFEWLLRSRGPDLRSWPAPLRGDALLLLRCSEAARDALADLLAEDPGAPAEGDADALRRMGGAVHRALRPPPPVLRGLRWGAIAACLAAGLYLGLPPAEGDAAAWSLALPASSSDGTVAAFGADTPATVLAALDE